jgi:inner membrane protein
MVYYDHGMVGATVAVALGAQRRYGWAVVALAALAGMFPDWDALAKHVSDDAYVRGHRVWGHNLFAATVAGLALGGLGYWIHRSSARHFGSAPQATREAQPESQMSPAAGGDGIALWLVLGVAILWTHPLLDLLYCGWDHNGDWPVGLLWPLVRGGYARPWMPWQDWGATLILACGLCVVVILPRYRQRGACICLALLAVYVAARGAAVQGL